MFNIVFLSLIMVFILLLYIDLHKYSISKIVLSHFWIFSFFYFFTYALTPYFLGINGDLQIMFKNYHPKKESLLATMYFSFFYWLIIYFGYKSSFFEFKVFKRINISYRFMIILALISIVFYFYFFKNDIQLFLADNIRKNMFEFADGNGFSVILQNLYKTVFIFIIVYIISTDKKITTFQKILFLIFSILLILSTLFLGTRRNLALVIFALLFVLMMKSDKYKNIYAYILFFIFIFTPFISSFLQVIRYMDIREFNFETFFDIGNIYMQVHVSSFEGQWLSYYFEKIDLFTFLFGQNPIQPLGNLLNFVPRGIYPEKSYILGILEIQNFLLPESFTEKQSPKITLPSTILVDFLYTFGVLNSLFIGYFIGVFLKKMEISIFQKNNHFYLFISIYIYFNIFNFIRSGMTFLFGLIIPLLILFLILRKKGVSAQ